MLLTSLSWTIWVLLYVIFRFCLGEMYLLGLETASSKQREVRVHEIARGKSRPPSLSQAKEQWSVKRGPQLPPSSCMLELLPSLQTRASRWQPPPIPHGDKRTQGLFNLRLLTASNSHNLVPKILMSFWSLSSLKHLHPVS